MFLVYHDEAQALEPRVAIRTLTEEPKLAAARVGSFRFDQVLGYFETKYATDEKHETRTYNLRLAASRLDGHVILPGETFDIAGRRVVAGAAPVAH